MERSDYLVLVNKQHKLPDDWDMKAELVETKNGLQRISDISLQAKKYIDKALNYDFDRYVYMDFNFKDK